MQHRWTGAASGPHGTLVRLGRDNAKPTQREALDAILDALGECDFTLVLDSRVQLRCGTADGVKLASYRGALALELRADAPEAYAALIEGGEFAVMQCGPLGSDIVASYSRGLMKSN
jgi:hypothetical protein